MPSTPIRLAQWIAPGRSMSPRCERPMNPSGSSGLPIASRIGLPSASSFGEPGWSARDRSGIIVGRCAFSGWTASVTVHQTIMMTAITVVAPMILSALSLDSWMPRMFTRQK